MGHSLQFIRWIGNFFGMVFLQVAQFAMVITTKNDRVVAKGAAGQMVAFQHQGIALVTVQAFWAVRSESFKRAAATRTTPNFLLFVVVAGEFFIIVIVRHFLCSRI